MRSRTETWEGLYIAQFTDDAGGAFACATHALSSKIMQRMVHASEGDEPRADAGAPEQSAAEHRSGNGPGRRRGHGDEDRAGSHRRTDR